jgi:hypothetical protein
MDVFILHGIETVAVYMLKQTLPEQTIRGIKMFVFNHADFQDRSWLIVFMVRLVQILLSSFFAWGLIVAATNHGPWEGSHSG